MTLQRADADSGGGLREALSAWAAGVTLLTIADDRDDIGTTVSAFLPVSLDPPLVAVSLIADSYPAEVLSRPSFPAAPDSHPMAKTAIVSGANPALSRGDDPPYPPSVRAGADGSVGTAKPAIVSGPRFAVTLLSAAQKLIAGQFAAAGRPSARLILDAVPHVRGATSGALVPSGGLAALECSVARRIPAGDHLLVICAVEGVTYVAEAGDPLVRFRGRYPAL
jgi:flavin reductase (DIM6/NTAB) family NADH-FMN oxidoreductase RutF